MNAKNKTATRIQASAAECGAVCLGIVLEHFGRSLSSVELRKHCSVSRDGATVAQIQRGAVALGFTCRVKKKGIESLRKLAEPAIVHWDLNHFVVLEALSGNHAWINDPSTGRRRLTVDDFKRHYSGVCLEIEPVASAAADKTADQPKDHGASLPRVVRSATAAVIFAQALAVFCLEFFAGAVSRVFFDYVLVYDMTWWGYATVAAGLPVVAVMVLLKWNERYAAAHDRFLFRFRFLDKTVPEVFKRDLRFFEGHYQGEVVSRLMEMESFLGIRKDVLQKSATHVTIILLSSALIAIVAPILVLVSVCPSLVLLALTGLQRKRSAELTHRYGSDVSRFRAYLNQRSDSYVRYHVMGLQDRLVAGCLPAISKLHSAKRRLDETSLVNRTLEQAIARLTVPVSLFFGIYLMASAQISYGDYLLVAAMSVILVGRLRALQSLVSAYQTSAPTGQRAFELLSAEGPGPKAVPAIAHGSMPELTYERTAPEVLTEMRNVGFGYNGSDADTFSGLNLTVRRGSVICLAGASGCGKTTCLELLAGLREPLDGQIFYEGKKLAGPCPAGFVFADDVWVDGSLSQIVAGASQIRTEKLEKVLRQVELWNRLGFFVHGEGTEDLAAQNLSRGEIQRLLLAKALYHNEQYVLFDEAFSHVSFGQAERIIQRLRNQGTTLVMASQRSEIKALADVVPSF